MRMILQAISSRPSWRSSFGASWLAAVAVGLAGCSEEVYVSVSCEIVADPALICKAQQTKGKTEVEVCWDFVATCGNGVKVEAARACVKVKDGATVTHRTEKDKLTNLADCGGDTPPTAVVANMTINGKASTLPVPAAPAPAEAPAAPAK